MGWINFFATIFATYKAYWYAYWYAEYFASFMLPRGLYQALQMMPFGAKAFAKKLQIPFAITEAVILFHTMLFFLWLFNTIVLQLNIFLECYNLSFDSIKIAATNALGGAIPAAIIVLVWNIITAIPFPITKILLVLEVIPYFGTMIIMSLLLVFNLAFGAGVGNAVAMAQACPSKFCGDKKTCDNR